MILLENLATFAGIIVGIFVLFLIATLMRSRRRPNGLGSLPEPRGPIGPSSYDLDRERDRQYMQESERQHAQLEWEAEQRNIWGS